MYRQEYPRPELIRDNWVNLNGRWEFEMDVGVCHRAKGDMFDKPKYERVIEVPFCPESKLSGIEHTDFINAVWYRRKLNIKKNDNRVLLNFEASYYKTEVFINGKSVGFHKGGYTPFSFDVTEYVNDGENTLVVYVEGDARDRTQPSGKQSFNYQPHGCLYTRSTGIWSTVWLEYVPQTYLKSIKIDTDIDNAMVLTRLTLVGNGKKNIILTALLDGKEVGREELKTTANILDAQIRLSILKLWDTENPNLYDLKICVESESGKDEVQSYFGMRSVACDKYGLRLNGKYIYQRLVLDQGYYPDGIVTAPKAEDMEKDILLSKRLGFNGARLHQKVFERRYLYYADKHGYLCWAEYPSWGFNHHVDSCIQIFLNEWMESVERDYNHPCIIGWTPLNEAWEIEYRGDVALGFCETLYRETKRYDPFRLFIGNSGGYHTATDIFDVHDYEDNLDKLRGKYQKLKNGGYGDRDRQANEKHLPFFLSEWGGTYIKENSKNLYAHVENTDELVERFCGHIEVLMTNPEICASCYTQLYDIEGEINGFYYYDRTPKLTEAQMDTIKVALQKQASNEQKE